MRESQLRAAVRHVADRFGARARTTILCENEEKHVQELRLIVDAAAHNGTALDAAVIDVGGGVGVNLLALRELGWTGRLVLVDKLTEYTDDNHMGPAERPLELLAAAHVDVLPLDIWPDCKLPFADGTFDIATIFDVIEHLPGHPRRQLTEMRRVLKPSGRCIVGAPNAVSLMKRVHLARGRHPYMPFEHWASDDYIYHYREYTAAEYATLLELAGYRPVRTLLSYAVPLSRARAKYHRQQHHALSPVALALRLDALVEALVPPLRHSVYCVGEPLPDAVAAGSATRVGGD